MAEGSIIYCFSDAHIFMCGQKTIYNDLGVCGYVCATFWKGRGVLLKYVCNRHCNSPGNEEMRRKLRDRHGMKHCWWGECTHTQYMEWSIVSEVSVHTHTHEIQVVKHCKKMSLAEGDNIPLCLMEDNGHSNGTTLSMHWTPPSSHHFKHTHRWMHIREREQAVLHHWWWSLSITCPTNWFISKTHLHKKRVRSS